jgi:predicted transcriptional regulator YdeE
MTPTFEDHDTMLIAGEALRFSGDEMGNIPALWARVGPTLGNIPAATGAEAYGVLYSNRPEPKRFEYVVGIRVTSFDKVRATLARVTIPPSRYAAFSCSGLSELRPLLDRLEMEWRPGQNVLANPDFLERYTAEFNPATGIGRIDVIVPLKD